MARNAPCEVTLLHQDQYRGAHDEDFVGLDDSLGALAAVYSKRAKVAEPCFSSGLSVEETAEVPGISRTNILRNRNRAKAWLMQEWDRGAQP